MDKTQRAVYLHRVRGWKYRTIWRDFLLSLKGNKCEKCGKPKKILRENYDNGSGKKRDNLEIHETAFIGNKRLDYRAMFLNKISYQTLCQKCHAETEDWCGKNELAIRRLA